MPQASPARRVTAAARGAPKDEKGLLKLLGGGLRSSVFGTLGTVHWSSERNNRSAAAERLSGPLGLGGMAGTIVSGAGGPVKEGGGVFANG